MSDPDLLKKLELMANIKAGETVPSEVAPDPWNWAEPVIKLFGDALEEIRRLSAYADILERGLCKPQIDGHGLYHLVWSWERVFPPAVDAKPYAITVDGSIAGANDFWKTSKSLAQAAIGSIEAELERKPNADSSAASTSALRPVAAWEASPYVMNPKNWK